MNISLQARPFQLARMAARLHDTESFPGRIRVGSVVARGNGILSVACNRKGIATIPVQGKRRPFWNRHAEVRAIQQADLGAVRGATVWVWRELKDGTPALARPCEDCMELLKIVGVKYVVYTTSTAPFFAKERIDGHHV